MILKERTRIIWGSIFILFALGLAAYFIYLASKWMISDATLMLALLTAVLSLSISLFNNVKLRKNWKK